LPQRGANLYDAGMTQSIDLKEKTACV